MPILNMVGGGKKGGNIGEPLNLTVNTSGLDATIKWEDNEIGTIPPTTFAKSELVRKIGSAPTSPSDGTLVVTETVKDTYKTTGYVDQGLTDGETYYYRVFSYSDLGGISYCDAVNVTPSGSAIPTSGLIAYYPFDSDMNDHKADLGVSGTTYNCTPGNNGTYSYVTGKVNNCIQQSNSAGNNRAINTGITLGNVFSLSCWVCLTTNTQWTAIAGNQYPDEGVGFRWQFNNLSIETGIYNNTYSTGMTATVDTRFLYTITQDGTELKQYVNGELKSTDTVNSTAGARTLRLVGRGDGYGTPCKMDDVLVYDRVLTASEISTYYQATA